MPITGHTRIFFIVGSPVAQVLAPQLFNPLFQRHGVDAVLVPAEVPPEHLTSFVRSALQARNVGGLWVTIPHKAALLPLLGHCDPRGQLAQAVNAVRRHEDGSLEGALFDGQGFVQGLAAKGVKCAGQRARVVGVGGAGTAIAVALAEHGVARLSLLGLDEAATDQVANRIARAFPTVQVQRARHASPAGCNLVVNATPLGLKDGDPMPFNPAELNPGCTVVDILMKPEPTPLVRACRERGLQAHMGHDMLLQQVPDYLEYFGYRDIANNLRGGGGHGLNELRQLMHAHTATV